MANSKSQLTEEGLECSVCQWTGCEADATRHDFDDEPDGWACPECGEPCAHTPMDEWLDGPKEVPPCKAFKPGDRVFLPYSSLRTLCVGVITEAAKWNEDGDWLVYSDDFGHEIARYEREMESSASSRGRGGR